MAIIYAPAKDFFGWFDKQAERPLVSVAKERGWELHHTGGGCMAFSKTIEGLKDVDGCDVDVMITDGDADIPDDPDKPCMLGYWYDAPAEGNTTQEISQYIDCSNFAEAMDKGDAIVKLLTTPLT